MLLCTSPLNGWSLFLGYLRLIDLTLYMSFQDRAVN